MCFDFVVLCFAMLLAFAVRFDPASLEQHFRTLSEGIWALIAVQMLAYSSADCIVLFCGMLAQNYWYYCYAQYCSEPGCLR